MISLEKLKVYEKHGGDIDWVQKTKDKIVLEMSLSGDWAIIDDVVQRWIKVKNGVASSFFQRETQIVLDENFEKVASEYLVQRMKL